MFSRRTFLATSSAGAVIATSAASAVGQLVTHTATDAPRFDAELPIHVAAGNSQLARASGASQFAADDDEILNHGLPPHLRAAFRQGDL